MQKVDEETNLEWSELAEFVLMKLRSLLSKHYRYANFKRYSLICRGRTTLQLDHVPEAKVRI